MVNKLLRETLGRTGLRVASLQSRGLTQKQIAAALRMSERNVRRIVRGNRMRGLNLKARAMIALRIPSRRLRAETAAAPCLN